VPRWLSLKTGLWWERQAQAIPSWEERHSFGIADPLSSGFVAVTGYNSAPIGSTLSGNDVAIYTGDPIRTFEEEPLRESDDDFGENYISPVGLGDRGQLRSLRCDDGKQPVRHGAGDRIATNAGALWKVTSLNWMTSPRIWAS